MTHLTLMVKKLWNGDVKRRRWNLFFYFMIVLEFCYRLAVAVRNYLYDKGIATSRKLPCAVISIGNIVVGGTGKTPAVIMLAQFLKQEGFKPAVLSRGYGGNQKKSVAIVSDGVNILSGYREAGDEPVLMSIKFSGIPVIVGACRFSAGEVAINKFGANVLILDDGFQHRSLHRDLDILLLDNFSPIGNGRLLPAGSLREHPDNINRAEIIILTGSISGNNAPSPLPNLKNHQKLFHSCHKPVDIAEGSGNKSLPLEYLQGKRIFAFAGIGNHSSFYNTIRDLGGFLVGFTSFLDHHIYSSSDVEKIREQARAVRAEIIITTEKDGVRLQEYEGLLREIFILRIEFNIISEDDAFRRAILQKLI